MDVWNSLRAREFQRVARIDRAQRTERAAAAPAVVADTTTSVAISKPATFLRSLSAYKQTDEKGFQETLGAVASNLKAAANSPSGAVGAELGKLADQLMVVANTGNLAGLNPSAGPRPGAMQRAIEAYRRHAPPPSGTVEQALDYVQEVVRDKRR